MKKVVASILFLIYFAVSSGLILSAHYCMDELNNTEISFTTSDTCGKCGMETTNSNGCCRDEYKVVKIEVDQLVAKALHSNFSLPVISHVSTDYLLAPFRNFTNRNLIAHSPPLLSEQETYIENCVFRI